MIGVLTEILAFCVFFGLTCRAVGAVCAGGVLVVVFHTAAFAFLHFSGVLLASVALSLTVDEDCRGLQAFWNKAYFCNLLLSYYFYNLLFLFES